MSFSFDQRDDPKVVSFFAWRPRQTEPMIEKVTPSAEAPMAMYEPVANTSGA